MSDSKFKGFFQLVARLGDRLAGHAARLFRRDTARSSSTAETAEEETGEVNTVIAGTVGQIRQAVGAKVGVFVHLAPQAMTVAGDSGDVSRILLDLVLNAREAVASSGVITIETRLLPAFPDLGGKRSGKQPCIRLTVSDGSPADTDRPETPPPAPSIDMQDSELDDRLANVARTVHRLGGVLQIERRGPRTRTSVYLPLSPSRAGADTRTPANGVKPPRGAS